MFADLLLTVAIAASPLTAHSAASANSGRIITNAAPSCVAGPIRVRFRTPTGMVQVSADSIRVEGVDRTASDRTQAE